jgi:hypothetical protein
MSGEAMAYLILAVSAVVYLNSNLTLSGIVLRSADTDNLSVIEHLTKYTVKSKNYRRAPKNFQSHGYRIYGKIKGEEAVLTYQFPLVNSKESKFSITLHAKNVSSVVNGYGVSTSCFGRRDQDTYELKSSSVEHLQSEMNRDGFYFHSPTRFGIDYNHVITISKDLSAQIAYFISEELQTANCDNYVNRVKAALNFVQFIPYGVPDFDHEGNSYFGLALPHESISISYSDCDSKSVLFAGILHHLIPEENIILVGCTIDEGGHMIVGVSDLPFVGQRIEYGGKSFMLLETTVPAPIEFQPENKFKDIEVIPVYQV